MATPPWLVLDWDVTALAPLQHVLLALDRVTHGTADGAAVRLAGAVLQRHPRTAPALVAHLLARGGLPKFPAAAQHAVISLMLTQMDVFAPCADVDILLGAFIADGRTPWHLQETATQVLITWLLRREAEEVQRALPPSLVALLPVVAVEHVNDGSSGEGQPKRRRIADDVVAGNAPPLPADDCDAIVALVTASASWSHVRALAPSSSSYCHGSNDNDNGSGNAEIPLRQAVAAQLPAAPSVADKKQPVMPGPSSDGKLEELLVRCRAHRTAVLRATGGAPSSSSSSSAAIAKGAVASVPPKALKQLAASAATLLTHIAALAPTSASSSSGAAALAVARALLALALHRAPDELLAEVVATALGPAVGAQGGAAAGAPAAADAAVVAVFAAGALLPRIRALSAPASRWLVRAAEGAVKSAPAVALPLLARCTRSTPVVPTGGSPAAHGQAQSELLQRLGRQAVTPDQAEALVWHICAPTDTSTTGSIPAAAATMGADVDRLLFAAMQRLAASGEGKKGSGARSTPGTETTNNVPGTVGVDEEAVAATWWAEGLGQGPGRGDDGSVAWDAELLKAVAALLAVAPPLRPRTLAALLAQMDRCSLDLTTATTSGAGGGGDGKASAAATATAAALATLMHGLVTKSLGARPAGTGGDLAGLRRDAAAVLARCDNVAGRVALAALQKLL